MSATMTDLVIREHFAPNNDGWLLHLKQTYCPERLDTSRRPVVIVPGYGMNAFIFGFHPRGTSMERWLAEAGLEIWSVNLRRQGPSRPQRPAPPPPSLRAYAEKDVTAAVHAVTQHTVTDAPDVDIIGCSLGGSIAYAHVALNPDHRVARIVAIGSPLRWEDVPALFKLVMSNPDLVGRVPFVGTRRLAGAALPVLARVPGALTIYMNSAHVDVTRASELVRTVEDPHPRVNRDIAKWMRDQDMVLRGVNITQELAHVDLPLLVVISNRDGIVPDASALSVLEAWGGDDTQVIRVGTDDRWYAHADLFIGDHAPSDLFGPLVDWLAA